MKSCIICHYDEIGIKGKNRRFFENALVKQLKEKAKNSGIPYQTLINTVLHKYITNQLLEKNEVLKSLQVLKSNKAI